jgi:ankyrin repeat protein
MTVYGKSPHNTELFAAVEKEDLDLVSQLIAQRIDPNTSSANGWTPLMLAILSDSVGMVRVLLENGADPNLTTCGEENPRRSPLAVSNGRLEAVRLLLSYNADVNLPNIQGQTPIALARKLASRPLHRENMVGMLSLLKEYQAAQPDRELAC